jgi:hypothetical protein
MMGNFVIASLVAGDEFHGTGFVFFAAIRSFADFQALPFCVAVGFVEFRNIEILFLFCRQGGGQIFSATERKSFSAVGAARPASRYWPQQSSRLAAEPQGQVVMSGPQAFGKRE